MDNQAPYTSTPQQDNGTSSLQKRLKILIMALGAVALILLGVLLYVWFDRNGMIKDLNLEKDELTGQMQQLRAEYDSLSTSNDTLNAQLNIEKERVDILIEKVKETEATNRARIRQYEKELGTLRTIMRNYIHQIDSLNTLNVALRKDAATAREEARSKQKQYEDLRSTTDEYARKVEKGSVVKGRSFSLVGITEAGKDTDRSSRVVKLKTCLHLIENTIAATGPRKVYIRVKGPDGILLTNANQGVFHYEGEQLIYSAMREVDYQGQEVEICIYFADASFAKGVYSVEIFTDQTKLGGADCLLR